MTNQTTAPLDDAALHAIIEEELAASICFKNDSTKNNRTVALDYYQGVMTDMESLPGRSAAVSMDVADTVDTMMPGLMRVFFGSDKIVNYEATRPEDVEFTEDATQYVNHVFVKECNGYSVLHDAFWDALVVRNGIIKVFWDESDEETRSKFSEWTGDQVAFIDQEEGVAVHILDEHPPTLEGGEPTYSGVLVRNVKKRALSVECVPPEDFYVSHRAKSLEQARFVAHRTSQSRTDLLNRGYDPELVDRIGVSPLYDRLAYADRGIETRDIGFGRGATHATEEVDVYEAYILVDMEGDGLAKRRKVIFSGMAGGRTVLSNELWEDELPFVDLKAIPFPHRWMGQSVSDKTMDVQRVKTALTRGYLDSVYGAILPEREVVTSQVENMNEVYTRKHGGVIRVKAAGAVRDLAQTFTGDAALEGLKVMDGVLQRRTGVSTATTALDQNALTPQTATAEQISHDASYAKVEFVARNFAEMGLNSLFQKILKIIIRNQDQPRMILLNGQPKQFDPRYWNASLSASVSVGLGTGSRERDLTMLRAIAGEQDKVVQELGPDNPVVTPKMWRDTRARMVEASGIKNPEAYFSELTDEQYREWQSSRPQPQDPKVQEAAAKMQLEREKAQADNQLAREKMQGEFDLRLREMELEAQLKGAAIGVGLHAQSNTNIPRHG